MTPVKDPLVLVSFFFLAIFMSEFANLMQK